jgi:K+-transporting ATPase ATPase C chain
MRFRQTWTAIRALVIITIVVGVAYPLLITGIGQLAINHQANGSLVEVNGSPVGSVLIGQSWTDSNGNALPQWFQSRPSAAGKGYDGTSSSGSNYGPENSDLIKAIGDRQAAIEKDDNVTASQIPADAVTASASGLDPHISPAYARIQEARVAQARGLTMKQVSDLVESMIQQRDLGYLGDPTVNVLELNIALSKLG